MKKIYPPTHFATYLLVQVVLYLLFPNPKIIDPPYHFLGIIIVTAGIGLTLWSNRLFRIGATTVKPDKQPSFLIKSGPYRLSRNPMYLGMALILLGIAALLNSVASLAGPVFFFAAMELFFIPEEEKAMAKAFGSDYRKYQKQVRRWI